MRWFILFFHGTFKIVTSRNQIYRVFKTCSLLGGCNAVDKFIVNVSSNDFDLIVFLFNGRDEFVRNIFYFLFVAFVTKENTIYLKRNVFHFHLAF